MNTGVQIIVQQLVEMCVVMIDTRKMKWRTKDQWAKDLVPTIKSSSGRNTAEVLSFFMFDFTTV